MLAIDVIVEYDIRIEYDLLIIHPLQIVYNATDRCSVEIKATLQPSRYFLGVLVLFKDLSIRVIHDYLLVR